jgi:hypothetical protein
VSLLTHMSKLKSNSSDRLKKIQLALYLDADQVDALKALSARTRVPQQVYLREGLEHVLEKYRIRKVRK